MAAEAVAATSVGEAATERRFQPIRVLPLLESLLPGGLSGPPQASLRNGAGFAGLPAGSRTPTICWGWFCSFGSEIPRSLRWWGSVEARSVERERQKSAKLVFPAQ